MCVDTTTEDIASLARNATNITIKKYVYLKHHVKIPHATFVTETHVGIST